MLQSGILLQVLMKAAPMSHPLLCLSYWVPFSSLEENVSRQFRDDLDNYKKLQYLIRFLLHQGKF